MRILALASWWPEPADNGSRLRIANLLRALAASHELHLISMAQSPVTAEQQARVRQICASVVTVTQRQARPGPLAPLRSLLPGEPASVRAAWDPDLAALVRRRAAAVSPELVVAFQLGMAPYARLIREAPRVLEELELAAMRERYSNERRPGRRLRAWLTWHKHRSYVQRVLADFDACTVVSDNELALAAELAPRGLPLVCVPNGADLAGCVQPWPPPEPDTLVYPGALSYEPNYDAVAFFLTEVMPRIADARPAARLRVTGRIAPGQVAALPRGRVEFTGYLPDIRPAVAGAWAEVVPLRKGGGTRLKLLEALALGTPVVSTRKGAEGLELEPGLHLLVADTSSDFAAATVRLLGDPSLRARLAAAGRQAVRERYDWALIGRRLNTVLEGVARQRAPVWA